MTTWADILAGRKLAGDQSDLARAIAGADDVQAIIAALDALRLEVRALADAIDRAAGARK